MPASDHENDGSDASQDLISQRELLIAKRERWFAAANSLFRSSADVTARNHHRYKGHQNRLLSIQREYDQVQEDILALNLRLQPNAQVDTNAPQKAFDDMVEMALLNYLAFDFPAGSTPAEKPVAKKPVSLPKLSIPKFNGDLDGWHPFINLFNANIHEDQTITPATKFSYLLTLLTGEPLNLVQSLPLTDANYEVAYLLLVERYQTEKRHIFHNFQGLLDLPAVKDSNGLPQFLTKVQQHMHALAALKIPDTMYGPMLVTVLHDKLSNYFRRRLDDFRDEPTNYPTLEEMINFLKAECSLIFDSPPQQKKKTEKTSNALVVSGDKPKYSPSPKKPDASSKKKPADSKQTPKVTAPPSSQSPAKISPSSSTAAGKGSKPWPKFLLCPWCDTPHSVFNCEDFNKMSPAERQRNVAEQKRCQNCLGKHSKDSCLSEKRCFKCHAGHHTLLHEAHASTSSPSSSDAKTGENHSLACTGQSGSVTNVIPTAKFIISSPLTGETLMVRFIIDSGASDSYLTSRCAQHLRLKPAKCASSVTGLGQTAVPVDGVVKINVHARDRKVAFYDHPVYVVRRITGSVPSLPLSKEVRVAVSKVLLADDTFADPSEVDGLLGADLFPRILSGQNFSFGPSAPMGLNTIFGVILIGPTSCEPVNRESSAAVALLTHNSFCDKLERFWELEEVPTSKRLSADEELAEKIYAETTVQQSNWRYMVRLPFKPNHPELGSSRTQAQSQFASLERRFAKDPNFHAQYVSFMEEYLANGYMSEVDPHSQEAATGYYLPHHGVLRDSATTRLRVVFNASAPSSNGVSLNDILLPGVPLQKDIRDILLDFRRHAVVFTADIKQMFLQLDLHPDDRKYQLILWRKSPDEPLKIYSLNTVTFGVTSSPFLSIRTILRLADEYGHLYPRAAEVLRKTVFVDDILGGDKSEPLAKQRLDEIIELLRLGGFVPRKFTSNAKILSSYPVEDLAPPKLDDPDNPRHSILGLDWISTKDCFTYLTNPRPHLHTKRGILSQIAAIYDPCGWIAPVVFSAKAFMQEMWTRRIDWDDPLPDDLKKRWDRFLAALPSLRQIMIPRLLGIPDATNQLHGFCDGSEVGYSAVLYLRSAPADGSPAVTSLVIAKTRVAPLKRLNIPRLELSGATLLAKLLTAYLPDLKKYFAPEKIFCWTDSSTVLSWVYTPSYKLKTFVGNRVASIQELPSDVIWRHCRSADNAADCASRGLSPADLPGHSIWWNGPAWLAEPQEKWPQSLPPQVDESRLEIKAIAPVLVTKRLPPQFISFSSWIKGLKVVSWILRFYRNVRKRVAAKTSKRTELISADRIINEEPILLEEQKRAQQQLLKLIQKQSLSEELHHLKKGQLCSPRYQHLAPFIDDQGLIRVGGRLKHSGLPADTKHPILLPNDHPMVPLLVRHMHETCLHAGAQLTQAHLFRRFWIIGGRRVIRSVIYKCIPCFRAKPRNEVPLMGDLPASRVTVNPAFAKTSVDYAGPFKVKVHQLRSARQVQVYLAIFVCMCTKAVHIEVVHRQTTEAFIQALHRFSSRRGRPTDIFSDCGTNFVGASNALSRLADESDPDLQQYAKANEIKFHFNPPAAPHQGGLWESAVKNAKKHLTRMIGTHILYLEEFETLASRVEAMLNSRPLTPLSSDPNDFQPLTPGHFLIGRPLTSVPEESIPEKDIPRVRRWYLVTALFQQIWRRWQLEYVHSLQPRQKWTKDPPPLQVGTLVLVHDPHAPTLAWKMGRVSEVFPGSDNRVRVAVVKTSTGSLKRPVIKLFPLPIEV